MGAVSPTVVLTATARRAGMFGVGDWVVPYRVARVRHSVTLVQDGVVSAGPRDSPSLWPPTRPSADRQPTVSVVALWAASATT